MEKKINTRGSLAVMEGRDVFRLYVDKAFVMLKAHINPQTGFISVHRGMYENKPVAVVPTYENFLFVALLLQKRTHETVLEAKRLLSQLLYYQNHVEVEQHGNFPNELTAYPHCDNWTAPFLISSIYALIIHEFACVLGEELIDRLRISFADLYACAQRTQERTTSSYGHKILLAAAYAQIVQDDKSLFPLIQQFLHSDEWKCPAIFGHVLTALSWLPELYSSLLCPYIYWHEKACTYQGPPMQVHQCKTSPEITLLDMVCSLFCSTSLLDRPWTYKNGLEIALLNPEYRVRSQPISRDDMWAIGDIVMAAYRENTPVIRIVTQDATVYVPCEGLISLEKTEDCFIGTVDSAACVTSGTLTRWYIERKPEVQLLVHGEKASVFAPHEGITLQLQHKSLHISFITHEAQCLGHVSIQNRPGQIYKNMADIGYDWCINVEYMRGSLGSIWQFQVRVV